MMMLQFKDRSLEVSLLSTAGLAGISFFMRQQSVLRMSCILGLYSVLRMCIKATLLGYSSLFIQWMSDTSKFFRTC